MNSHLNNQEFEVIAFVAFVPGATIISYSLFVENPSCLHTTLASFVDQKSSHTVPQVSLKQISTLPSLGTEPPNSLTSPSLQTMNTKQIIIVQYRQWFGLLPLCTQRTLASSKWEQSPVLLSYLQSISLPSDPVHLTSSMSMEPLPRPKRAYEKAEASMSNETWVCRCHGLFFPLKNYSQHSGCKHAIGLKSLT